MDKGGEGRGGEGRGEEGAGEARGEAYDGDEFLAEAVLEGDGEVERLHSTRQGRTVWARLRQAQGPGQRQVRGGAWGGTAHLASRLSVVRVGAGASGDRAEVEVARASRVAELEVDAVLGEDLPTRVACVRRQSGRDERVRAHQKVVGEPDKVAAALVDILGVKVNASGETVGDKAELGRLQSVPRERKQQDGDEEDGEAAARGGLAPGHAAHVAVVAAGILWGGRACV